MNISYKRTSNQNYMIIEGDMISVGFEESMLQENFVPCLLEFSTMELNGQTQFWYDISHKKSLRDFFEQEGVTEKNLKTALWGIHEAFIQLSEYLIGEENIFMKPDTVFLDQRHGGGVFLCYLPLSHPSHTKQLQEIMEYLISTVDHHKTNITKTCYEMYAIAEQSRFGISDLLAVFDEEDVEECKVEPEEMISEEDIKKAAFDAGESFFEKEPSIHRNFLERVRDCIGKWRNRFLDKKEELFPEDVYLEDLEFDEVVSPPREETGTILLSEDESVCCGKLVHDMGGTAEDFIISHTPFRIGSKAGGNDAVLSSSAVSRYHAKITREDGIFMLEDLNSTNGTFLNGKLLNYHETVPLKAMDTISFADVVYHII